MFYTRKGRLKNFFVKYVKSTGKNYLLFDKKTKKEEVHLSKVLRENDDAHNLKVINEIIDNALDGKGSANEPFKAKLVKDVTAYVSINLY